MNEHETNTTEAAGSSEPKTPEDRSEPQVASGANTEDIDIIETDAENDKPWSDENVIEAQTEEEEDIGNRMATLESRVEELNDKLLRALAETENVRRRAQRDKEDAAKYGIKNFAEGMLGVADNLGRALASINPDLRTEHPALENIVIGIEMVQKDLVNTFERYGVTPIAALGAKFDPMLHEAMFEIEDKEAPSGTVAQVLEPGYELNGRTLRAAKVGITKGGPKEATDLNSDPPGPTGALSTSDPASRDGQAAYESHTETVTKSGGTLDEEL